jgi:hypothetical protein
MRPVALSWALATLATVFIASVSLYYFIVRVLLSKTMLKNWVNFLTEMKIFQN